MSNIKKEKYLLNVNGKRYKAKTFISLIWKYLLGKTSKR
jgi:hypothetical protein